MHNSTNDANPGSVELPRARRSRFRDGPKFVTTAFAISLIGAIIASIGVGVVFAVAAALQGELSPERLAEAAQTPTATWITLIVSQGVTLLVALLACRLIAAPARQRLAVTPPTKRRRDAGVLLVATIVPVTAGLLAASVMPSFGGDASQGLTRMWSEGSRATSVLWVLTIAVIPGIVEEIFYRGLVLRGFLLRWGPAAAIVGSSVLFAVAHLDPAHAAFTFIVGLWLGVVAWRTGSVVLPILMHAGMNGSWTTIQMIAARSPMNEDAARIALAGTIGIGAVAFIWALVLLRRSGPSMSGANSSQGDSPGVSLHAATDPCVTRPLPARALALGGAGLAAIAALLAIIIPPGAPISGSAVPAVTTTTGLSSGISTGPTASGLREQARRTAECPSDGEAKFALSPGEAVRVRLPSNRAGTDDAIVALDASGNTLWLVYDGQLSGKKVGAGVLEQLQGGDPALMLIHLDAQPTGLDVRFSLVQDQTAADAAWAMATTEPGWATRGKK